MCTIQARSRPLVAALLFGTLLACWSEGTTDPEPLAEEDPCSPAAAAGLELGESSSGTLGSGDCTSAGQLQDRWQLRVASDQWVEVTLTSPDFDTWLEIRDASGTLVAENDDWDGYDSRVLTELEAGTYTLVARGFRPGDTGRYTLSARQAPECAPRGQLVLGDSVDGTMDAAGCPMAWGAEAQFWSLDLTSDTRVRIDLESDVFDEVVLVLDDTGNVQHLGEWTHPVGFARAEAVLPAGSWRLAVTSHESVSGAYSLSADTAPSCGPGTVLAPGDSLSGVVDRSDCLLDGWLPADSLGVDVPGETDLLVQIGGSGANLTGLLFDEEGREVAWSQSWDPAGPVTLRSLLPQGAYTLIVGTWDGPLPVDYEVRTAVVVCGEALDTLAVGASVAGTLDETDCIRPEGQYRDDRVLSLESETEVVIDLTSKEFDAYLLLEDSTGATVAVNDDGGADLDARIRQTLPAGHYTVVASSFGPGMRGAYELSVNGPAAAVAAVSEGTSTRTKSFRDTRVRRLAAPGWGVPGGGSWLAPASFKNR